MDHDLVGIAAIATVALETAKFLFKVVKWLIKALRPSQGKHRK